MRKKTTRPKWAKKLKAADWNHLVEMALPNKPTLRALKIDGKGGGCIQCELILRQVTEGMFAKPKRGRPKAPVASVQIRLPRDVVERIRELGVNEVAILLGVKESE